MSESCSLYEIAIVIQSNHLIGIWLIGISGSKQ